MKASQFSPFSVLMTVYYKEKPEFLDKSLASIENQTITPNEIIVVEDGQVTPELENVLLKHQRDFKNTFKIIRRKQNQGQGIASQAGIKYVTSEWIARMDSDDIAVPNRFELQLKKILEEPNLSVVGGQVTEFSKSLENIIGKRQVPLSNAEIINFMKWRNPINNPTVMINRQALDEIGGYTKNRVLEDYFLWVNMAIHEKKMVNLPETLVYMRTDEGLYKRRGGWISLKWAVLLRKKLRQNGFVSRSEELIGDVMLVGNLLLPTKFRELIYKFSLHKK